MAGGERERELQRQLAQAALRAEAALESQAAALASDSEATVQRLLQQRDTANAALNVSTIQRGSAMDLCEASKVVNHWESGLRPSVQRFAQLHETGLFTP